MHCETDRECGSAPIFLTMRDLHPMLYAAATTPASPDALQQIPGTLERGAADLAQLPLFAHLSAVMPAADLVFGGAMLVFIVLVHAAGVRTVTTHVLRRMQAIMQRPTAGGCWRRLSQCRACSRSAGPAACSWISYGVSTRSGMRWAPPKRRPCRATSLLARAFSPPSRTLHWAARCCPSSSGCSWRL